MEGLTSRMIATAGMTATPYPTLTIPPPLSSVPRMRKILLALMLSGSAALAADESLLRDVEQIGSETTYDKYASTVFDGQGRFCVVRTTMMSGIDVILFRCRDGARWSADVRLDAGAGVESGAKVVRESDGSLRVFWHRHLAK